MSSIKYFYVKYLTIQWREISRIPNQMMKSNVTLRDNVD
jgi:hypothetical protein